MGEAAVNKQLRSYLQDSNTRLAEESSWADKLDVKVINMQKEIQSLRTLVHARSGQTAPEDQNTTSAGGSSLSVPQSASRQQPDAEAEAKVLEDKILMCQVQLAEAICRDKKPLVSDAAHQGHKRRLDRQIQMHKAKLAALQQRIANDAGP